MTKFVTPSKLTYFAAILAVGLALNATANISSANARHHNNDMSSGDHSSEKADKKHHKGKKKKDDSTVKKDCRYVTSDGKRCGTSTTNNGNGGTKPLPTTGNTGVTGDIGTGKNGGMKNNNKTPPNAVSVSNGARSIDISNNPQGLIISSDKPGTITVFNGVTSQTFQGGSVTLHGDGIASGAVNTQVLSGLKSVKLPNGDVSIAIEPAK